MTMYRLVGWRSWSKSAGLSARLRVLSFGLANRKARTASTRSRTPGLSRITEGGAFSIHRHQRSAPFRNCSALRKGFTKGAAPGFSARNADFSFVSIIK